MLARESGTKLARDKHPKTTMLDNHISTYYLGIVSHECLFCCLSLYFSKKIKVLMKILFEILHQERPQNKAFC